ncbi:MAG TPA: hypothetical protein VMD91_17675 [Candidatus Sulfotelmatobacter sp.]|nr:hypothetical protein [Candidatus Sulfotelmatobacter sp.]
MPSLPARLAVLTAAVALLAEAPAPLDTAEAARLFALSGQRTAAVQSYTSKLHVDVALRSFPYLKLHLEGEIRYQKPNLFSVHFEHVPWFGKGFENMKMDPLVPATWPAHYEVTQLARAGDRTLVDMHDKIAGNIRDVHAELDPDGLRRIVWHYTNGGRIEVRVNPTAVQGVPVPASEDAEIVLPAYHVVAHATFSDYAIVTDAGTTGGGVGQ